MSATDLAIRIATTLDSTGINRAGKAIGKLQRTVKGLGAAFALYEAAAFGKNSAKAFIADELAAAKLTNAVKNLGLEFANPYITDYIANLEKTSQVADDELRPAFQRLLQQTGSISKSQSILNTAIEVSRGSTESLSTVSEDLAKAYYGNTKSLQKYSLGLTKAELQTKSFSELQDILAKKFQGSNAAYLNTYAGQLDVLSLAWSNLQENAGKALFTLAGANGDQSSGARRLGSIVDAFGVGLVEAAKLFNNAFTAFGQAYFGVGSAKPEVAPAPVKGQELFRKSSANDAKLKKIEADQAKLYKAQLAASKALTAEQKKQAALKKAGSVFDLDQIQLVAALKGDLSKEERMRVEAMAALLNGNDVLANSLTKQILYAQDQSGKLYNYFLTIGDAKVKNPFEFLDKWIVDFQKKLDSLTAPKSATYVPASIAPDIAALGVQAGYGDFIGSIANQADNTAFPSYGMQTAAPTVVINNTIQGNLIREQELINQVLAGAQLSSLSGSPSQIGRIAGMFG
jgi:hypothetical protein